MWPAVTFTATAIALISTFIIHFQQDQTSDPVAKFASQNTKKYDDDLIQLAKIASISSLPEHNADILKAAEWLVPRLKAAELEVDTVRHVMFCSRHCSGEVIRS